MYTKPTVLYVDDEVINLKVFELTFANKFSVITKMKPEEALEELNGNKEISVVISDMKMPRMNGVELITTAIQNRPDVHYLILTGYGMNDEIQSAIDNGLVKHQLQKPFNKREIEQIVNDLATAS